MDQSNNSTMDNSTNLIEKIKEKQLKPLPRWLYLFKDTMLWILYILSTIFGSLAFSVILFVIQQVDFNIIGHMSHSWFELLLGLVPFLWIISLVICLLISVVSLKNSKKGYKLSALSLVGLATALSILIGTFFFISGGGKWLEDAFATNVSQYESMQERKMKVWSMPEDGSLSGTILSAGDETFELEDFKGKSWMIDYKDADIVPAVVIIDGEKIKMTGNMTSDATFKADKIRPWGGFQHRYHGGREK
jgi:hypothetical protein